MRSATALKRLGRIRVGLIGPADPTMAAFVEALQRSSDYVVIGRPGKATAAKALRATPKARATPMAVTAAAILADPDVDLAAILSTGEAGVADARAAIQAGRDIYIHAPLTIGMAELAELHALAQNKNIRHIVGLSQRLSGSIRFAGDLVKDGYIGKLQTINIDAESDLVAGPGAPTASYPLAIAIHAAELLDAFDFVVGSPRLLFGFQAGRGTPFGAVTTQANRSRVIGADGWAQLYAAGSIGDDAAFSICFASRHRNRAAIRVQITGDDGDLSMSNSRSGSGQDDRWRIAGARGSGTVLRSLAVPKSYAWSTDRLPAAKPRALANIFAAFARDLHELTALTPTLEDAVRLHRLAHAIVASSETGRRVIM